MKKEKQYTKDNIEGIKFRVPFSDSFGIDADYLYTIAEVKGNEVIVTWEEEGKTKQVDYTLTEVLNYLNQKTWVEFSPLNKN